MKTRISFTILALAVVLVTGCTKYPPSSDRLLEDLAVITQYDTKVDFNNYKTYGIADGIIKITDKDTTVINNQTTASILSQIGKNMESRGFVKVATGEKPDFGIQVVYYQNTYITAYYGGYWGYPYYGWYYPYYPVYYSSYTAGMLDIELLDMKFMNPDKQQFYLRWNGYIRGLLTGSHTTAEINNSVNQAFIQTPQLKTSAN